MSRQTLILEKVPESKVETLSAKYRQMGSKVESAKQDDGSYTLRIIVEVDEVH
jgi:hypothetical protein